MKLADSARRLLILVGGIALLGATAVDTLAIIGRHIGLPFAGSIEIMQALVLISGATGLVVATVSQAHARVRLIVDRLPPRWKMAADSFADLASLAFFAVLLAGSIWIALDLWSGHEQSEVVGVPWRWLRMTANVCLLACCVTLAWRIVRRAR